MKVKVTKAMTINGRYFEAGSVHEMDEGKAGAFRRLYGWVAVPETKAVKTPTPRQTGVGASANGAAKRTKKAVKEPKLDNGE